MIGDPGVRSCASERRVSITSVCMTPDSITRPAVAREWLDADEAYRYLSLPSRKALYQAVRRGQLPVHRLGKRMRFNRAELDDVLLRR